MDLTTFLAIYGAVLSTIAILWNLFKDVTVYRLNRPYLKVEANYGLLIGSTTTQPTVKIIMVNIGKEPLTVVESGFRLDTKSDENLATVADPSLPKELAQNQRHTTSANFDEVITQKILYAWARDATGRIYRSKKWPLRT
ncbi:MAG: hypothetical protein HYZ49_02450 [Chloroflexi bacterium]|nr:hypothetical protein [Chloroflexota bacterium]